MMIQMSRGDYGSPINVPLYYIDGRPFSQAELATATFNLVIWRVDHTQVPVEVADTKVYVRNVRRIFEYKPLDTITVGDEIMSVVSVDATNQWLNVNRPLPIPHLRREVIRHTVDESATAVAYNASTGAVQVTLETGMPLYPGMYNFEIEIETGTRKASINRSSAVCGNRIHVIHDGNGG